jgi:NDP-sugar pyrophosphorylase family protein
MSGLDPSKTVARAAVIAAGLGERLSGAGAAKPLVRVAGVPLVDRALGAVAAAGIDDVACIFNESADAVEEHCRRTHPKLRLRIERRTTPSSMESLFALAPHLGDERFLLLTVDAVFGPRLLPEFLDAALDRSDADAVLAMHSHIDDEKPLRIAVAPDARVTAIGEHAASSPTITAGLYVLSPRVFAEIDAARRAGCAALRQFFGHLLARGYRLYGVPVGKTIDVDRPEDIAAAEAFLRDECGA